MIQGQSAGAIQALLDEYTKAIDELIVVIQPLTSAQLCTVLDPDASNPDTRSIQTILTHICASIFSYAVYIENDLGFDTVRPARRSFNHIDGFCLYLNEGLAYTKQVFIRHPELDLEELNPAKKILSNWGQQYDVEQMMEHAIVHILRHRRQISKLIEKQNWYKRTTASG